MTAPPDPLPPRPPTFIVRHGVMRFLGEFAAPPGAAGRVVIWAHARSYGLSRIIASLDGGPAAAFWVFAYP